MSPELATALIADQFPELAGQPLELLGAGWDNVAYLVDRQYVFRFPQRTMAIGLMERESRVLPLLAPHLPLPVSSPVFIGRGGAAYPHPFAGYRLISGTTACRVAWTDDQRAQNAAGLGRFLAALHPIPIDAETLEWAPLDELGRSIPARRLELVRERLGQMPDFDGAPILRRMEELAHAAPWKRPPVWVHGDLYARHLIAADHEICGVIDWGDVHVGDPALDISVAFSFLPSTAWPTFRDAYGGVDDATWDRARFRALFYGVVLTHYGREVGDEDILRATKYALGAFR